MKKLYIIGNGFDLHHSLDTWYTSFGLFLKDNYNNVYEHFLKYFGFGELDEDDEASLKDPLWSDFESSLALLDPEEIIGEFEEFAANPASDDFREGDWDTIAVYVSQIRDELTIQMLDAFKQFINNVNYPLVSEIQLLQIDKSASFFNFNYTNTLERYYSVQGNQINYIHNKADGTSPLVLGHGRNPNDFKKEESIPPNTDDPEELQRWHDEQADNFDYSIERGRDELELYFSKTFKPTSDIIHANNKFFESLKDIEEVYILGHSLSLVDQPYIQEIIKRIKIKNAPWYVTYYGDGEKGKKTDALSNMGLNHSQIKLIQMIDLI